MEYLSVSDAAERLGVNERRVRQLIEFDRLTAHKVGKRWIVDSRSIEQMRAADRRPGRPYSSRNTWALLVMAAGREPAWLPTPERRRLRRILDSQGISELLPRMSRRAETLEWYVHPSLLERLSTDARIVVSGAGAIDALIDESLVELYLPLSAKEDIEAEFFVEPGADRPNVIARVIDGPWPFEPGQNVADPLIAAADLRDRPGDPRRTQVAEDLIANA